MIANLPVIHQEITTHSGALSPTEGSPPAPRPHKYSLPVGFHIFRASPQHMPSEHSAVC